MIQLQVAQRDLAFLCEFPGVKENKYAVAWVDFTEEVRRYAWDFGSYMSYHSPASPDLPTYPDTTAMRVQAQENTPGAYFQIKYSKSLTEFQRGFMDGITEDDVFYCE